MQLSSGEIVLTWIIVFATATSYNMVKSDYVVMVNTHYFNNPQSLLWSGSCCAVNETRGDGSCAVPGCDMIFWYCMQTACKPGKIVRSTCRLSPNTSYDEQGLNFSASSLLGLPNPLPLRGPTKEWTPNGVSLLVAVFDYRPNREVPTQKYQAIFSSEICIQNNYLVGEEHWATPVLDPPMNASMSLSIRVVCAENYYGPDCSQYCASNCSCDPGYTGEFCHEIDDCLNVTCDGNRVCLDAKDSYTCVCRPGYTGSNCEININECESMNITCSNRGECVDGINNFACDCDEGFTGEFCHEIDDCLGVNCSGNGVCVDGINNFACDCVSGFIGELCQTNTDGCLGVDCSGNGVCVDGVDSFLCQCETGYSGTLCDQAEETQSSAFHHGTFVGGVLGIIIFFFLVFIFLLVIVLMKSYRNRQRKSNIKEREHNTTAVLPDDNSVYEGGNIVITPGELHTSAREKNPPSGDGDNMSDDDSASDSIMFINTLYGDHDNEEENVYAEPDTSMECYNKETENVYADIILCAEFSSQPPTQTETDSLLECMAYGGHDQLRQTDADSLYDCTADGGHKLLSTQQELNNTYDYIDIPTEDGPKDKTSRDVEAFVVYQCPAYGAVSSNFALGFVPPSTVNSSAGIAETGEKV